MEGGSAGGPTYVAPPPNLPRPLEDISPKAVYAFKLRWEGYKRQVGRLGRLKLPKLRELVNRHVLSTLCALTLPRISAWQEDGFPQQVMREMMQERSVSAYAHIPDLFIPGDVLSGKSGGAGAGAGAGSESSASAR